MKLFTTFGAVMTEIVTDRQANQPTNWPNKCTCTYLRVKDPIDSAKSSSSESTCDSCSPDTDSWGCIGELMPPHVRPSRRSVCWSVCHNFVKEQELPLLCFCPFIFMYIYLYMRLCFLAGLEQWSERSSPSYHDRRLLLRGRPNINWVCYVLPERSSSS